MPRSSAHWEEHFDSAFCGGDGRKPVTGEELRDCAYRLKDNYARFYLKFIEPSKDSIDGGAFEFGSLERLSGWNGIMGLQFENLIVKNFKSLLPKLNLAGALKYQAVNADRGGAGRAE